MSDTRQVFIGTDCGATMSKVGGVWADGTTVSTKLYQHPTSSEAGTATVVAGWVEAVGRYLAQNGLAWEQVSGVGLAIPGPYLRYGVLGHSANMPAGFEGWDFYTDYAQALAKQAGRAVPLVVGNDGAFGGVGEAHRVRGSGTGGVLMLAPGSGLGSAFIDARGLPLAGDTLAGMETAHMAAPLHLLGAKPYPVRLRPDLGLRRALHDAGGPALSAGGAPGVAARSPARQVDGHAQEEGAGAARAGSERATRWPSSCSISRPAPWATTSPTWRWRSIPSSSSSAAG